MSSLPYIEFNNIFNPNDFTEIDSSLNLAEADSRYFKIAGGYVSGFSTFLNSLDVIGTLSINSAPIDLSLISGITAGTCTASKALVVDSSKNITGLNTIQTTNFKCYSTIGDRAMNYLTNNNAQDAQMRWGSTLASNRCFTLYWSSASQYFGFDMYGSNNQLTIGASSVGIQTTPNGTYTLDVAGLIRGTTSITTPSAIIRNNAQASGTRSEYMTIGRETGSDYGAWSFQNYYQSATAQQANYCTFTPSLKTSLSSGYGICINQSGQVSIQDVNTAGGAGGIVTASNIIAALDVYGGVTRTIGSNGALQNNATPAVYNGGGGSTRIGLYVVNAIWTADKVYASSDVRLKRNIVPIELDEAKKLLNIKAVSYRWKKDIAPCGKDINHYGEELGVIAQDVLEADLDKLVSFLPDNDKDLFPLGYHYGVSYDRMTVYLLELVKDLYKQIDELKRNASMD